MVKSVFIKILIIILLLSISSCNSKKGLNIVKDGFSDYEIVVEDQSSKGVYLAAIELQNYIEKISNISLLIVAQEKVTEGKNAIFVQVAELDKNQIQFKANGENIIISGGSESAVKNAVYEFLELYLGCKWYAPNVEKIPKLKTITIDRNIDYSYTPQITTRTVHSRLFYENNEYAAKHKVTATAFPYYVPSARVHTFNKFIPEEKFYKSNPEYFALRGNKRLPTQLCLTNTKVLDIVKDAVGGLFKKHPKTSVISVSGNDNTQYCECEDCKKVDEEEGSHSGTMIRFVNEVAKSFPEKTISTLAYQYTRKPCKTKPLSNVLITLCSIECDRSAAITEKCTDFAEDIKGWSALTKNIRIWDYTTQFTNFLAPFPNIHTLQPNIQFFRDNNTKWVFEQHSNNPSELFELRSYIMAKLLWNPDRNVDDLITEFTNDYYEEAGVYVKKYVDLVHKKIQEDKDFFLFLYGDPSQAFSSYLNPTLLNTYESFFNEAETVVKDKSQILKRVQEAKISIDYVILEACKKSLSKKYSMVVLGEDGKNNINENVIKRLEKFYTTCKAANITLMNEMGFTVSEYYKNYKKAIEVAVQPNKAKGKKVTLLTKPKKYAKEDPQTLTDGALGGNNFYANWLGFEGNHMEAVIDLDTTQGISYISTAFLQVTNHIVFYPKKVNYFYSNDNINFIKAGTVENNKPLSKNSKINNIKYFELNFSKVKARYVKVVAENMNEAPYWHHAAGLPSWVFADEVLIN